MVQHDPTAQRVRAALMGLPAISEKRMMGGICFFSHGHMLGGADRAPDGAGRLMFRVGKDGMADALSQPGATQVQLGRNKLGGFIYVEANAYDDRALAAWLSAALAFTAQLPPKNAA